MEPLYLHPLYAILYFFGQVLLWIYNFCHSYALTLVIFTLAIKVVLLPLSYKGKKSMMQMTALSKKSQQLQKQYGKDRVRYNEELQKLYTKEGVNPMGGCLWSLLPLPILIGLYAVIRRPLYYMFGLTADEITAVQGAVENISGAIGGNAAYSEIQVASQLNDPSILSAAQEALTAMGSNADKLANVIDFHFIGLNLADIPNFRFWTFFSGGNLTWANIGLFLVPFVVIAVTFLSTKINLKTNGQSGANTGNAQADAMNKQMMYVMPLMYLWFGYIMPAGMCVYMIANSVFSVAQDMLCAKLLNKKFAEQEAIREEQEALERAEEKRLRAERIAQREAEAKNPKKKKKPAPEGRKKAPTTEEGRIGTRPYARGRSYVENRYGEVTPYVDPSAPAEPQPTPLAQPEEETAPQAEETKDTVLTQPEETAAPAEEAAETPAETADETKD